MDQNTQNPLPTQPLPPVQPQPVDLNLPLQQQPLSQQPAQPIQQVQPVQPLVQPAQPVQSINKELNKMQTPHGSKPFLKVIFVLILIISATAGVVYAGYMFMGGGKTQVSSKNAAVVFEEVKATPTPTVASDQVNPNDTTDAAIANDTKTLDANLNNLNSAINTVDQGLSDKQTNLQ